MPNNRRRRFSVKNNLNVKDTSKTKNVSHSSTVDKPNANKSLNIKFAKSGSEIEPSVPEVQYVEPSKTENKVHLQPKDVEPSKPEKEITSSSTSPDISLMTDKDDDKIVSKLKAEVIENQMEVQEKREFRSRREKFPRQHRIKVRSPKRRVAISDEVKMEHEETIGTDSIDWDQEVEEYITTNTVTVNPALVSTNLALNQFASVRDDRSFSDMCRICHGNEASSIDMGPLISTCGCRGTVGRVHVKCLERWLTESGKSRCELCGTRYLTRRVHKYGLPKALIIWILSHNAKQLMVDSLGIMLMSPLAVMAAWLSGRTLARLLAQDSNPATWPLASTFVLACMTLVCYYCWIVSAVTRHALGWWIWYRSQYEVRLQFQDTEE